MLMREYNRRQLNNFHQQQKRIEQAYQMAPELKQIAEQLSSLSAQRARDLINGNPKQADLVRSQISSLKKRRLTILSAHGLPSDYMDLHYHCSDCKDTGYINNSGSASTLCSCIKQKLLDISYNKANISNLAQENFDTFNPLIYSDEVNFDKYKMKISPRANILLIKEKCIDFMNNFDNLDSHNLLFTGNTGLGKTFMTNCIASELIKKGKNVLYQTAPVLLETVIDNKMSKYKNSRQDDFYKNVLEADLLIIDDLGTECLNSMKLSELFTILNTRLLNLNNKATKTIISTNLDINNIFKNYEERIGSRIVGFYDIYYFFGDDLRFKLKQK